MKKRWNDKNKGSGKKRTRQVLCAFISVLTLTALCFSGLPSEWVYADEAVSDTVVRVGIVDGAVDLTHEAFAGLVNRELSRKISTDDSGNYQLETLTEEDYTGGTNEKAAHGTAVAGVIAAEMEAFGGTDGSVELVVIDAGTSDGAVSSGAAALALDYLNSVNIDAVNLSLAVVGENAPVSLQASCQELYKNGITIVCAAGNDNTAECVYPADFATTISVIALNADDSRWDHSNYGEQKDISAYGADVTAAAPGNAYTTVSGTSMAAPRVTAAAALLYKTVPGIKPAQVREILTESARDIGEAGFDAETAWGCLDTEAAMSCVQGKSAEELCVDITKADVQFEKEPDLTYTGQALTPEVLVKKSGSLIKDIDYTVTYENNVDPGTASAIVRGVESAGVTGSQSLAFEIKEKEGESYDIREYIDVVDSVVWTGEPIEDAAYDDHYLVKDVDYTVTFTNNTDVGTATVTFTGIEPYTGSFTTTFEIVAPAECGQCEGYASEDEDSVWIFDGEETLTIKPAKKNISDDIEFAECLEADIRHGLVSSEIYKRVKHIIVEEGISAIGGGCFRGFTEAETLKLPESLKRIDGDLFGKAGNNGIKELTIPDSVSIKKFTLRNMRALQTFALPDFCKTEIPDGFFEGCSSLSEIDLPSTLKTIGYGAFEDCGISTIHIPDSVTTIKDYAFKGCPLEEIVLPSHLKYLSGFNETKLTKIEIPDSVMEIGEAAFEDTGLTEVDIPGNVISISKDAFWLCPLSRLTISEGVESIGEYAFYSNELTELILPDSVNEIGECAFWTRSGARYEETSLPSASLPISLKDKVDEAFDSQTELIYREMSEDTNIKGSCGSHADYVFSPSNGTLKINGSGTVSGIYFGQQDFAQKIKKIVFSDDITGIAEAVFAGCTSLEDTDLNNVTDIGDGAFLGCSSLKSLYKKETGTVEAPLSIGRFAFYDCGLENLSVYGIRNIGDFAFAECDELTKINVGGASAGSYVFYGCDQLEEACFGFELEEIPEGTFAYCHLLKRIQLGGDIRVVQPYAFYDAALNALDVYMDGVSIKKGALSKTKDMPSDLESEKTIGGILGASYDLSPLLAELSDPEILIENESALRENGDGTVLMTAPGTTRLCIKEGGQAVHLLTFHIEIPRYADLAEVYKDAQKVQYDEWASGNEMSDDSDTLDEDSSSSSEEEEEEDPKADDQEDSDSKEESEPEDHNGKKADDDENSQASGDVTDDSKEGENGQDENGSESRPVSQNGQDGAEDEPSDDKGFENKPQFPQGGYANVILSSENSTDEDTGSEVGDGQNTAVVLTEADNSQISLTESGEDSGASVGTIAAVGGEAAGVENGMTSSEEGASEDQENSTETGGFDILPVLMIILATLIAAGLILIVVLKKRRKEQD